MSFSSLIINNRPIAGLSISDDALRLALFKKTKDKQTKKPKAAIKILAETQLAPGEFSGGRVMNEEKFLSSLKGLFADTGIDAVVVTIPPDLVFTKIYKFPSGIVGEKLKSSIDLITHFQLPKTIDQIYFGWQEITYNDEKESILAFIDKEPIDKLANLLGRIDITVVAVEFHALSLSRVISQPKDAPSLIVEMGAKTACFSILENNQFRLGFSAPSSLPPASLSIEAKKLCDAYEYEHSPVVGSFLLDFSANESKISWPAKPGPIPLLPELAEIAPQYSPNNWAIALGAAWRGITPRHEDNQISLMAIGTEEAYRRQKQLALARLLSKSTIAISLLLLVLFGGSFAYISRMRDNFNRQISIFQAGGGQTVSEWDAKSSQFNSTFSTLGQLIIAEPDWTPILLELKSRITGGITITTLSAPNINSAFSLVGMAKDRDSLNRFKASLAASPLIEGLSVPLDNIGKKSDIPFSVSFIPKASQ